jgi:hypothetical protein
VLRRWVLVFAGALAHAGLVLIMRGLAGPGAYALGSGTLIFLGTMFERWRYRPNDLKRGADWEPTGERFEDPQSGKTLQVFYDPRTGERHYVSDSEQARDRER